MPHGVGHSKYVSGSFNGIRRKRVARTVELQDSGNPASPPGLAELLGNAGQVHRFGLLSAAGSDP